MSKQVFSREELYNLVWSEPLRKLAPEIGVPESRIVAACESANIPLPGRGYWARRYHNKADQVPHLPKRALGQNDKIYLNSGMEPRINLHKMKIELPVFDESIESMRLRMVSKIERISLRGDSEDKQLRHYATKDERRRKKINETPLYTTYPWMAKFHAPLFDTPFERRRMELLDKLSSIAKRLGGHLSIRGDLARDLTFYACNTPISLEIDDARGRRGEQSDPLKHGVMRISIFNLDAGAKSKQWEDDTTGKVEKRLREIVLEIYVCAEAQHRAFLLKRYNDDLEEQARIRIDLRKSRSDRIELRRRDAKLRAKRRVERLLIQGKSLDDARRIRDYVAAVVAANPQAAPVLEWSNWALAQADRIDPIRNEAWKQTICDPEFMNRLEDSSETQR